MGTNIWSCDRHVQSRRKHTRAMFALIWSLFKKRAPNRSNAACALLSIENPIERRSRARRELRHLKGFAEDAEYEVRLHNTIAAQAARRP